MSDSVSMTGAEFIRRIRKLGRKRGVVVLFQAERGKGSHGTLYFGSSLTVVPDPNRELKRGTFHAMLRQLGLTPADFNE